MFFADLPIAPKEYIHPYDFNRVSREVYDRERIEREKELTETNYEVKYSEIIDKDAVLTKRYNYIMADLEKYKTDKGYAVRGLYYDLDESRIKRTLALIHAAVLIFAEIEKHPPIELIERADDVEQSIRSLYHDAGIMKDDVRYMNAGLWILVSSRIDAYINGIQPALDWYEMIINKALAGSGETTKLIKAGNMQWLTIRVNRTVKGINIGAPEPFMNDQYKLDFNAACGYFNSPAGRISDEEFDKYYGSEN